MKSHDLSDPVSTVQAASKTWPYGEKCNLNILDSGRFSAATRHESMRIWTQMFLTLTCV